MKATGRTRDYFARTLSSVVKAMEDEEGLENMRNCETNRIDFVSKTAVIYQS